MKVLLLVFALAALVACTAALPITHQARALVEAAATNSNKCTAAGGACLDNRSNSCSRGFVAGQCPGAAHIQCCPAKPASSSTAAPQRSSSTAGAACVAAGGECLHSGTNSCSGGAFRSGLCPGQAAIKCCIKNSSPAPTPAAPSRAMSFSKLQSCYPQGSADEVKARIGGAVNADWITNTCAVRMSQALNCGGFKIPQMGGESIRAGNRDNIIFRVKQLGPLMRKNFGAGYTVKAPTGRGVPVSSFNGKRGIIMFDTTGAWDDATGHFDLWDGAQMVENSHQGAANTERYFSLSISVTLWQF